MLHVGDNRQYPPAGADRDAPRHRLEVGQGARRDHHVGAVRGEEAGGCRADPGATAGDDRDAAREVERGIGPIP